MDKLTVRFLDNEVIEGSAEGVDLDEPDFHLSVEQPFDNNTSAWIPMNAVKKISLDSGPADDHAAGADKMVALRFQDGEIMRGYLNASLEHRRYGLKMTLYSIDKQSMDKVAIPYTSLKALFYLKSWDSRPAGLRGGLAAAPPLTELVGDIREVTRLYRAGAITRQDFLEQRRALLDRF
jgi:hypothetical protein